VAHSLSANKRIRQSAKRRLLNRDRKKNVRVELKKIHSVIAAGDVKAAVAELSKAQQTLDRVAGRGTMHKNTVARRKAKLAKKVNALKAAK